MPAAPSALPKPLHETPAVSSAHTALLTEPDTTQFELIGFRPVSDPFS
jgi:hypothetical protein